MSHDGKHTDVCQQRINARNSRATLVALLNANFQDGAQLLTLTYRAGTRAPSYQLAVLQVADWIRAARRASGQPLRYIRTTTQKTARHYPVHRIVLAQPEPAVSALAALWRYGPVTSEPIQKGAPEALAAYLITPALHDGQRIMPNRRIWAASRGLIRPGKEK